MGVLGALLVGRWSVGLMRDSAAVLLDRRAPPVVLSATHESTLEVVPLEDLTRHGLDVS